MMKRLIPVLALVLFLITTGSATGDTVTVAPLANNFPEIVLFTTVLDNNGNPITGLTQNDFTIQEQADFETTATTETITDFIETGSGSQTISFVLVFDLSGSMSGSRLLDAKAAAKDFINNTNPNDRGALVTFSSGGTERVVMTSDWITTDSNNNGTYDLIDAVDSLVAFGGTAVYDGTAKGVDSLSQEPSPKAVIVFTDGDTFDDELYTLDSVIAKANNESVPLYTIGLGIDSQNLKDMASATGGSYYFAPNAQDMAVIYSDIAQNVRSQYRIVYTTHNPDFDGSTRTVTATYSGTSGSGIYTVNSMPQFTLNDETLSLNNQSQDAGNPLTITGTIVDQDAQSLGQTVTASLFYRHINDPDYSSVQMALTDQGNGIYAFSESIPATTVQGPGIQYYLSATDGNLTTFSPFNYDTLPYFITVLPNHAPDINHNVVDTASENQPIDISAEVIETDAGDSIDRVVLYYRVNDPFQNTPYAESNMTTLDGTTFTSQIPANIVTNRGVDYFISAWDSFGARSNEGLSEFPFFINTSGSSTGNNPPVANAGDDQTVEEGASVVLDASGSYDPDNDMLSYQWIQTAGTPVVLSNSMIEKPAFVPVVSGSEEVYTFTLSVRDENGSESTDDVSITAYDNGIVQYPEETPTIMCDNTKTMGIQGEAGDIVWLMPTDPANITDMENRPDDLLYCMVDATVKISNPGESATVKFYLPESAPDNSVWYAYCIDGWRALDQDSTMNMTRDEITVSVADGSLCDSDGETNGMVTFSSSLGVTTATPVEDDDDDDDDKDILFCFIHTAASYPFGMSNALLCFLFSVSVATALWFRRKRK